METERSNLRRPWTRRRWIWPGLFLLALLAAFIANGLADRAKDRASAKQARLDGRAIPVRPATVGAKEIEEVVGATGVSEPSRSIPIYLGSSRGIATADLVVAEVHVAEGKNVSRGESLVDIDDHVFRRELATAQAQLVSGEAGVSRASESLELNAKIRSLSALSADAEHQFRTQDLERRETDHERFLSLYESGYLSTIEMTAVFTSLFEARYQKALAETNLERSDVELSVGLLEDQGRLAEARQRLADAKTAVDTARLNLERCAVTSPIDGVADSVEIVANQIIQERTALTTIHKLDPLHVRVSFPPERSDMLKLAAGVEVILDNMPQQTLEGRVVSIAPQVDPKTRALPVVVEVDNPDFVARAGIGCFVRFHLRRPAVVVPAVSVIEQNDNSMVFSIEDDIARIRHVRTRPTPESGFLEVIEGLNPGDVVVIYGQDKLENGDRVDAAWQEWAGRGE